MANPKVSFIVPVYNTQEFLPRCLDSLLGQTCPDIEIVVVNDGSPDDSAAIIGKCACKDSRVCVVEKSNGGLSSARNAGMNVARGAIIDFVDSDDYVEPNLAEFLVGTFAEEHPEIVVFGAECEPAELASKRIKQLLSPEACVFESFDPVLLFSANTQPYVWRAAYSRELIERESLRFAENVRFAEDVVFQFESYPLSAKTVVAPDKLYHYVMQEKSLTHVFNVGAKRMDKVDAHLLVLHEVLERWDRRGLLGLCPGELVTWFLDLIVFDLARLPRDEARQIAVRIRTCFGSFFGPDWASLPLKAPVRRVSKKLSSGTGTVSLMDAVSLYLSTRGLKVCLERFV
ncbi:glycosyltransferase family 2 protein [Collinsella sp. CM84Y_54]|uniref:glycosyltransferase family 2 protein n=1 Tax=Collinsella sp. CM84Y_54 TaxID=3085309 RepID=UPI002E79FDC2|nr:glycosyltransferase [Collinsella sp. CM84Y_54]